LVGRRNPDETFAVIDEAARQHLGTVDMKRPTFSRRDVFMLSTGLAAGVVFATPLKAAAPEPSAVTPALIEAARKEGQVNFYTALELPPAEKLGRAFEAKYPGIAVRVERSGAERIFQRIGQEKASGIRAVDVVCSTDAGHFIEWERDDWIAPYLPEEVAKHFPSEQIDPDGRHATVCAWLEVMGYNSALVRKEDAPRSFIDLLDPKWKGKLVKAHPGFSGAILTATFLLVRELGWSYFEKLAQQKIMQVQSAADPPKKVQIGERAVMADGNDYVLEVLKSKGQSVEVVYPTEGSPLIIVENGVFHSAPNPNAARLFQSFIFGVEAQQILVDSFAHRSFHALVKEKPGRKPLSEIKLLKADPSAVLAQSEEIKARYSKVFGL
jgi:iron(III) transport system substrate-binding protein